MVCVIHRTFLYNLLAGHGTVMVQKQNGALALAMDGSFFRSYFPTKNISAVEILISLAGSRAYGLATPTSDTDIRGVYIQDPRSWLGMGNCEPLVENKRDDCVLWELGFFIQKMLEGTPNMMEALWTDTVLGVNEYGEELLTARQEFLSTAIHSRLGGFCTQQMRDVEKSLKPDGSYDYKAGHHALRVISAAIYADETGAYKVTEYGEWADYLRKVKAGEVPYSELKEKLLELEAKWKEAREKTKLPEQVSVERAAQLLVRLRKRYLRSQGITAEKYPVIIPAHTQTALPLPDGTKRAIFVADGNDLLKQPVVTSVDLSGGAGDRVELRDALHHIYKGHPLMISALYSPEVEKSLDANPVGMFLFKWRDSLTTTVVQHSFRGFLSDGIRRLTAPPEDGKDRMTKLSEADIKRMYYQVVKTSQALYLPAENRKAFLQEAYAQDAATLTMDEIIQMCREREVELAHSKPPEHLAQPRNGVSPELDRELLSIRLGHIAAEM